GRRKRVSKLSAYRSPPRAAPGRSIPPKTSFAPAPRERIYSPLPAFQADLPRKRGRKPNAAPTVSSPACGGGVRRSTKCKADGGGKSTQLGPLLVQPEFFQAPARRLPSFRRRPQRRRKPRAAEIGIGLIVEIDRGIDQQPIPFARTEQSDVAVALAR